MAGSSSCRAPAAALLALWALVELTPGQLRCRASHFCSDPAANLIIHCPREDGALTQDNLHPKGLFTRAPQYADVFREHLEVVLCFVRLL